MTNLLRRLERLETQMVPPDDQPPPKITVVFVDPTGKVTGTLSSGFEKTSGETSEDQKALSPCGLTTT
jgi:hypothetical protein